MPYPVDFHTARKQPGADESAGSNSQSQWCNVPAFSFDSGNETTSNESNRDSSTADQSSTDDQPPLPPSPEVTTDPKSVRTPAERERELVQALVAAHRSLTRISQYVLKLEARAGIATKEDVRQTLDATLENIAYSSQASLAGADPTRDGRLGPDVARLGDQVWARVYLADQSLTRTSRQNRTDDGRSGPIRLRGESHTKAWLDAVVASNALMDEATVFYTVRDLAAARPLGLWIAYLRDTLTQVGGEGGGPPREDRVVAIAWAFLDRAIRPPRRPSRSTSVAQFVAEWEKLWKSGAFDAALKEPDSQRDSDAQILKSLKGIWSARVRPL
ncbi:hypothetical protein PG999_005274 [Apiospora kogelbergensis]|uniref:Uncharacterized protein n=1 Tax=Apiospora kogelbergensis TaxID=1337665 RepID=A0AAW0R1L6_9PEZI